MILVPQERIDDYLAKGWWSERTIGGLFLDAAERRQDELAVADPPNLDSVSGRAPRRWSWNALLHEVGRYTTLLHEQGLRKDDVLVMQLPNSVDMHAVYLACAISGIVVSPVPMQYRAHELTHIFSATGARWLITAQRVGNYRAGEQLAIQRQHLPGLEKLWALRSDGADPWPDGVEDLDAALTHTPVWSAERLRAHMQSVGVTAHDVLTICWTSGTEARPKGVPRNHNEWLIVGQSVVDAGQLKAGAQQLIPFPFVNMAGVSTSLVAWLLTEGGLHHHHPFDIDVFIAQLRNHPVDYTVAAPAVLSMLLKQPEKLDGIDLGRLRRVGSGGGPLADWLVEQFAQRFGVEVVNYYGSNEGAALSSTPQDIPDRKQRAQYFPRFGVQGHDWSAGNARKISTRLVDVDTELDITEPGRVGELRFLGPTIFSGYYNAPDLTARAFDAQGYYRTGDLFEIAGERQQFYRFAGRHKDIVIRGGMNISSEELENLMLGYAKIREVAVVGYADEVLGERVCAVAVPLPGAELTLQELVAFLRDEMKVAAYKLPEKLLILDELPRNPLGKVLKRQLRDRLNQQTAGATA